MSDAPLVDCHAHVWDGSLPFASDAWTRPDYCYTAEDFLADMDAQGIGFGVIAGASLFGRNHGYTLAALARHPRLRGTLVYDPGIEDLDRLREAGVVGMRLQWFRMPVDDLASPEFARTAARLRECGMHLHLNIDGERLAEVAPAVAAFGTNLVIDHFGWHDPAARLAEPSYLAMLRLLERDGVWVKLSSGFRRPDLDLPGEYAQDLLRRFGPGRLLWGSDAPFVGHEAAIDYAGTVALLRCWVPGEADRRAIGANGYRFYFGGPA
ncbi:MAG TPA: amidohydrolase family protein [Croceibacterium sp.]